MDRTPQRSAVLTRVRGRRALTLTLALTLPLLSACSPDVRTGFAALTTAPGAVQDLVSAPAGGDGVQPVTAIPLDSPQGVVVHQGVRYVADTGNQRVLRVAEKNDPRGTTPAVCVVAGHDRDSAAGLPWCGSAAPNAEIQNPTALAMSSMGDLFIADATAHKVFTVSLHDQKTTTAAGTGVDGEPVAGAQGDRTPLSAPSGLAVTRDGTRLYIADSGTGQVLSVDVSAARTIDGLGQPAPVIGRLDVVAGPRQGPGGAGLVTPLSLALPAGEDELFVADPGAGEVFSIELDGPGVASAPTPLAGDDTAPDSPEAVAAVSTPSGERLVVLDGASGAVVQVRLGGTAALTWSPVSDHALEGGALAVNGAPSAPSAPSVVIADTVADAVLGVVLPDVAPVVTPVIEPGDDGCEAGDSDTSDQTDPRLVNDPDQMAVRVAHLSEAGEDDCVEPIPSTPTPTSGASSATGVPSSSPTAGPVTSGGDPVITPAAVPSGARPKVPSQVSVPEAGTHRLAGADRVATAVDSSKQLFPKEGSAPTVVISSSSSFTDAAGGARLAAELGGPLLLTSSGSLDASVAAEVQRVLSAGGGVVVVGGEKAVSKDAVDALQRVAPDRVERVSGDDRYASAVALAERMTKVGGSSSTAPIYLVTGKDHPDALVVVALARRTGGVVVLSDGDRLPAVTRAYLLAQDPTGARTVPVGGAAAKAAATLDGDAGGRASAAAVVGTDRYDTARLVAERFAALDARDGARTTVVGLATGKDWPDALVGSTAMGSLVGPLLLNQGSGLDPATAKALTALSSGSRPTTFLVFGGEKAVPASAAKALGAAAQG